jgi:hypothetical protein
METNIGNNIKKNSINSHIKKPEKTEKKKLDIITVKMLTLLRSLIEEKVFGICL